MKPSVCANSDKKLYVNLQTGSLGTCTTIPFIYNIQHFLLSP